MKTRIAVVMVGTDDDRFRTLAANERRLELAKRIAEYTKEAADLVLLPAGFLTASDEDDVNAKARDLAKIFKGQALLAGIDEPDDDEVGDPKEAKRVGKHDPVDKPVRPKKSKRIGKHDLDESSNEDSDEGPDEDSGEDDAGGGYHYWAFAAAEGRLQAGPWYQRSARSSQQYLSDTTARVVELAGKRIGLLICGELYNHSLADSLRQAKPNLVANLCHVSMKRFTKSLYRVADTVGKPVLHVQHVSLSSWPVSKWQATRNDGAYRERDAQWVSYDASWNRELWAEVKIWRL